MFRIERPKYTGLFILHFFYSFPLQVNFLKIFFCDNLALTLVSYFLTFHKLYVSIVPYVLYSLKIIFCFCLQFRVHVNVWLLTKFLIELDYSVFFCFFLVSIHDSMSVSGLLSARHSFSCKNHTQIFPIFSICILSGKNGRSLCSSCCISEYRTSASRLYPLSLSSS